MKLQTLKASVRMAPNRSPRPLLMNPAATPRLRGRAAVDRRERFLRLRPLCVECEKRGKVSASMVPDHKKPLWAGGEDNLDRNGNALCHECHDAKTACEAAMRAAGAWMATPCTCGQHAPA